ncbi:MAG: DNA helicase II [Candidatus Eutrophobiaceae bacterium]
MRMTDITHIIAPLNEQQHMAVTAPERHVLVLAGAGSGKTRVLAHRVAWLISNEGLSPFSLLAVTFTNKAANEMRVRIGALLEGYDLSGIWIGTFHGLANRLLRRHAKQCGLPENFQILDSEDQLRLVRRVIRALGFDDKRYPPKDVRGWINTCKDAARRPEDCSDRGRPDHAVFKRIYAEYQDACDSAGLVDFAELLLRSVEMLSENRELRDNYQARFQRVLVDEFQDTSDLQYRWLGLFIGEHGSLFAVGDDDQSIYSWRGAKVGHIQDFREQFPESRLLRLEQNYRSTEVILKAANALIGNNAERMGKNLWTQSGGGERLRLYRAYSERDEAKYVVGEIRAALQQDACYADHAILYRVGAQSRALEEELLRTGVPYCVYGGLRFYERAEIKDATAYLRLAHSHIDDAAFERIVNMPPRGIGQQTLAQLRELARDRACPLWQASAYAVSNGVILAGRMVAALSEFMHLIEGMAAQLGDEFVLHEHVSRVIDASGLIEHYGKERGEKGQMRIENLQELVSAASMFEPLDSLSKESEADKLTRFLAHAALEAGETHSGSGNDFVHLMTLHAAKGLEFPYIFLVGMEEGLFPHELSKGVRAKLEEERRLCYVGITRARRRLCMSWAQHRRMHGVDRYPQMSRFIRELPQELCEFIRLGNGLVPPALGRAIAAQPSRGSTQEPQLGQSYQIGQRVRHQHFGEGVICYLEGGAGQLRVQIRFDQQGEKWLLANRANLQAIS